VAEFKPRHLVIVRHGESEGDVRRSAWAAGDATEAGQRAKEDKQTERGAMQSAEAGRWITKYVLEEFGFQQFVKQAVSPAPRAKQSAESLNIASGWLDEPLLAERDRGLIQGVPAKLHQKRYPESYQEMLSNPFYWMPPGGESIDQVETRAAEFLKKIVSYDSVLAMTHRDWIWASSVPLDGIDKGRAAKLDTDSILNAQVIHYTNINPNTGSADAEKFSWKRSVCPWADEAEIYLASESWAEINPSKS
jgi:broad specificity phosphatase PhoE